MKHFLFSYGTLQLETVQIETYGRKLHGDIDVLKGYKIGELVIKEASVVAKSNQEIHPIALKSVNPHDEIKGIIFEITAQELYETDKYEVSDYVRIMETFQSGRQAWVYVAH